MRYELIQRLKDFSFCSISAFATLKVLNFVWNPYTSNPYLILPLGWKLVKSNPILAPVIELSLKGEEDSSRVFESNHAKLWGKTFENIGSYIGLSNLWSDGDEEESSDEDKLRYDIAGTEVAVQDGGGLAFTTNSGTVRHHQTQAATYTIAASEGQIMAGPVTVTGTITNNGTLVIM